MIDNLTLEILVPQTEKNQLAVVNLSQRINCFMTLYRQFYGGPVHIVRAHALRRPGSELDWLALGVVLQQTAHNQQFVVLFQRQLAECLGCATGGGLDGKAHVEVVVGLPAYVNPATLK